MQKLKLSKISIFLHMNLYLSCKIFQKNGLKSNEFLDSSKLKHVPRNSNEKADALATVVASLPIT